MTLHNRIMRLPVFTRSSETTRDEAANLAADADDLIEFMADTLKREEAYATNEYDRVAASSALEKYNAWKEAQK